MLIDLVISSPSFSVDTTEEYFERSCDRWPLWKGYVTYELASARKHGACRSSSDEDGGSGSESEASDLW